MGVPANMQLKIPWASAEHHPSLSDVGGWLTSEQVESQEFIFSWTESELT